MQALKTLYIMRHAKAETGAPSQDDHQRELNEQGIDACEIMGKYLLRHGIAPDLVLCSTAQRASDTWSRVQAVYKKPLKLEYSERLYLASANEIINIIAAVPAAVGRLMIVGHNPGLHQLALNLAKSGDEKLLDTLALKFPTCAFAALDLGAVTWDRAGQSQGVLKDFATPRLISNY